MQEIALQAGLAERGTVQKAVKQQKRKKPRPVKRAGMLLTMEEIKAQLRLDEDFDLMTAICNCWPVRRKSGRKRIEPEALCTG